MKRYRENLGCIKCEASIDMRVFRYSLDKYSHPLCIECQSWFNGILKYTSATDLAIDLYFALRERGVPAVLENSDGFKSIDIAVRDAKVYIEVDGMHHSYNGRQALTDLKRTLYSYKKGYSTLRVPNSLLEYAFEQTADLITEYLVINSGHNRRRYY